MGLSVGGGIGPVRYRKSLRVGGPSTLAGLGQLLGMLIAVLNVLGKLLGKLIVLAAKLLILITRLWWKATWASVLATIWATRKIIENLERRRQERADESL